MAVKTRQELIKKYIEFFRSKKHRAIPSASLIPENDPTVLFTTAGMHPLVPFLLGQAHPLGKRIVNVQKCIRTDDIDEVGDEFHHTFFEMLGNWSFGDAEVKNTSDILRSKEPSGYFKREAIEYSFEFLTKVLKLEKEKLAVSCFAGDKDAPRDDESAKIWLKLGIAKERIAFLPKKENWWGPADEIGPCGPDTEMFYWTGKNKAPKEFDVRDKNWVEIGNNVFMEYEKIKRIILVDGMNCLYDKDFKINKELFDFLETVNARKMLVVNNYADKARELLRESGYDVFSFDGKITKDNFKFFEGLLMKYGLNKDELIYFDHKKENIETAKRFGIKNVLLYQGRINKVKEFITDSLYYYKELKQKNVDFGGGVERTLAVLNGFEDNYLTMVFTPIIGVIEKISGKKYKGNEKAMRIIADHLRAAVFILGDERGIKPSNLGQGYVLRRLIRRAIRYGKLLGIENNFTVKLVKPTVSVYTDYHELKKNFGIITKELNLEEERFRKTLENGLRKFNEIAVGKIISGKDAFLLFQSYGFPIEMTSELAKEKGMKVEIRGYEKEFRKHQELSRSASAGQFKSGLADDSDRTRRLHTATHLLNEALRRVLGNEVRQRGSNITPERARFDFNFSRKLTSDELQKIENLVNEKINKKLKVVREEMPLSGATKSGAQAEFGAKYPEIVSVYAVLDSDDKRGWFSKEICTGPHVSNTFEIGRFKIIKEEGVAAGVRRIKAVVE